MIIYNKSWLSNLAVQDEVKALYDAGKLSSAELKQVNEAYPVGFYTPNIFVRTGLFLLTLVIAGFSGGLITLLAMQMNSSDPIAWLLFSAAGSYFVLEVIVKQMHHFKSGVDDALLWVSGGCLTSAVVYYLATSDHRYPFLTCCLLFTAFMALLTLYLTLRFADQIMAVLCFLNVLFFAGLCLFWSGSHQTLLYCFLMILLSGLVYYLSKVGSADLRFVFYQPCLEILQVTGLLFLYVAGNYFVVENFGQFLHTEDNQSTILPVPYLFWAWTILIPLVYIGLGIRTKNAILLRSGLILVTIAAITFKNYHHLLPIEFTLVIAGAFILGITYYIIQYLKTPKNGFTYEDLKENNVLDHVKIESLIISSMDVPATDATTTPPDRFGGGSFGGGGASGDF